MGVRIVRGSLVATQILKKIQKRIISRNEAAALLLKVMLVGNDYVSQSYARAKQKLGAKIGIRVEVECFPLNTSINDLNAEVRCWNNDQSVNGIIIEMPLPATVNKALLIETIDPKKDVDGMTNINRGFLSGRNESQALLPATPMACIEMLASASVTIEGKHAVVIGRSNTVGRPLSSMLLNRNATLTVCHSYTNDLSSVVRRGDIVLSAAGVPGLITGDMIQPGAVVIDAGITSVEHQLVGDVDWESVSEVAGIVTPVPGGVGAVTTTMIMSNVLRARMLQEPEIDKHE